MVSNTCRLANIMLPCSEEATGDCPDYSRTRLGYEVDANRVAIICGAGKESTAIYLHSGADPGGGPGGPGPP